MRLSVKEIAQSCNGAVLSGPSDAIVTSVTWDSRRVYAGALYFAFVGDRVDGHSFCADAMRAGAKAVVVSKDLDEEVSRVARELGAAVVRVGDAVSALTEVAGSWRRRLRGDVIALTGSSGKTTTKNLVRDVLSCAGDTVATAANQNNEIGVPATLLAAEEDTDYIVVEMGMRGLGQLAQLCSFVAPDRALVTNVGTSHLELLGSREAIAQAKAEPFTYLDAGEGIAYINASDGYASKLVSLGDLAKRGVRTVFFDGSGADPASYPENMQPSVFAEGISFDSFGRPTFVLHGPSSSAVCALALAGAHNVHNAMAAAALGFDAGLDAATIAHALEQSMPESGRQMVRNAACGACVVDDSYNANPESACASLSTFSRMDCEGRRIAVLGDMLELGDYTEEGHKRVGAQAAACGLDLLVCVGPLSRTIAQAAIGAGMDSADVVCVDDAAAALEVVGDAVNARDAVLVKASHSVGLERVVEGLVG